MMRLSEIRTLQRWQVDLVGCGDAPAYQDRAASRSLEYRGPGDPGARLCGPLQRVGISEPEREPLQPALREQGMAERGPGGWSSRLPLSRPPAPPRNDGAERGIHGADCDGPGRVEDRTDDAAVCGGDR